MGRTVEFDEEAAIAKAMNVFWAKGYNGASMRDLTAAMQINSSSLYNTIGDKQELFRKCIRQYTQSRMADIRAVAAAAPSPRQAIIAVIKDTADYTVNGTNSCLGIKTTFEIGAADAEVRAILQQGDDAFQVMLLHLVQAAMATGEMDPAEEAAVVAGYIINSFTGWYESYVLHQDLLKITKMADYLIRNLR
jgi:TetR/AcrR family transcriptional repressor of nem operon